MKDLKMLMAKLKKRESFESRQLEESNDSDNMSIYVLLMISSHFASFCFNLSVSEFRHAISSPFYHSFNFYSFVMSFFPFIQFITYQFQSKNGEERQEQDERQQQ